MDWLLDDRTSCYSVQATMPVGEYLELVREAHAAKGGLSGQRDALKTTTAKRIRARMVNDIRRGAVLPPVVIGAVLSDEDFNKLPDANAASVVDIIPQETRSELAIIDGMQRTTALLEAAEADKTVLNRRMRVEFWITRSVRTMVYRMLVLNTGQVPWTLSRQLSVVFAPLLSEMRSNIPDLSRIFTPDNPGRRVAAGEYGSDALVELYLSFSLRKTNVDTKEALSDEFSRLDFVENLSDAAFQTQFYGTISVLALLDKSFDRYDSNTSARFARGRNVFDGQPARIGFVVAVAQHVLGRPGLDRNHDERVSRMTVLQQQAERLVKKLDAQSPEEVGRFLALDVLNETLDRRVGQVGRYERGVFFDAFQVLIEESFDLPNMEPCWRAN